MWVRLRGKFFGDWPKPGYSAINLGVFAVLAFGNKDLSPTMNIFPRLARSIRQTTATLTEAKRFGQPKSGYVIEPTAPRKNLLISIFAGSVLVLCCSFCCGQHVEAPPISTDRPSVATGTDLVPVHSLQFENGIGWIRDQSTNSVDGPETEVRFGLSHRVELQAFLPNLHRSGAVLGVHFDDFSLGAKIRIGSEDRSWPVSIVGNLSFPTGSEELTSGGFDPTILVATGHNLPHNFQLSGSANLTSLSNNGQPRVVQSQLAVDLCWCANPKTCFFVEEAPFVSTAQNASGYTTDGTMTLRIARRVQLDGRVGTTIKDGDRAMFASVGYSFRLDHR